jgi:SAM-dependent methyltransferase
VAAATAGGTLSAMASATPPHDPGTVRYFDEHAPEYSVDRLAFAASAIAELAKEGASLVDLGCGAGNTLAHLVEATPVSDVVGVDVSQTLLDRCRDDVGCPVVLGSIVDPELAGILGRRFDFAVVAAVLHHLIGPTRARSREYARAAVRNALALLEPGGHLVVVEPVFAPRLVMDGVFYVKQAISSVTSRRVFIGDNYWTNFGAPVVSYYGNEELEALLEAEGAHVVDRDIVPQALGRLNLVLSKTNTTLIARAA